MLEVSNLKVGYGQSQILGGINLKVDGGKVIALLGRNGVGKTTLLKALMGVLKPQGGQITYSGQNITAWPAYRRARSGIAYVPQGRGIFPYLSVAENLLVGTEAAQRPDEQALDEMYRLFPVLAAMSHRMAGLLSGGQQQQLAIARALISKPQLLLLDEPTEGIQPSIVNEIEEVLISLRKQGRIAILLVEQYLDFALGVADYCYVMEKGSIVLEATPDQITQDKTSEYLSV